MNENQNASETAAQCETRSVNENIARKRECIRSAEDSPDRIPRIRGLLYGSILAQLDTQIGMLEAYESSCVNYPARRREMARMEEVHRRMREANESCEMATMVLQQIDNLRREQTRSLLAVLTQAQTEELARQAAIRQIELEGQPRYVKARRGLAETRNHLYELRQLRVLIARLLGNSENE